MVGIGTEWYSFDLDSETQNFGQEMVLRLDPTLGSCWSHWHMPHPASASPCIRVMQNLNNWCPSSCIARAPEPCPCIA